MRWHPFWKFSPKDTICDLRSTTTKNLRGDSCSDTHRVVSLRLRYSAPMKRPSVFFPIGGMTISTRQHAFLEPPALGRCRRTRNSPLSLRRRCRNYCHGDLAIGTSVIRDTQIGERLGRRNSFKNSLLSTRNRSLDADCRDSENSQLLKHRHYTHRRVDPC